MNTQALESRGSDFLRVMEKVHRESLVSVRWTLFYAFLFLMFLFVVSVGILYLFTGEIVSKWSFGALVPFSAAWVLLYLKFRQMLAESREMLDDLRREEFPNGRPMQDVVLTGEQKIVKYKQDIAKRVWKTVGVYCCCVLLVSAVIVYCHDAFTLSLKLGWIFGGSFFVVCTILALCAVPNFKKKLEREYLVGADKKNDPNEP